MVRRVWLLISGSVCPTGQRRREGATRAMTAAPRRLHACAFGTGTLGVGRGQSAPLVLLEEAAQFGVLDAKVTTVFVAHLELDSRIADRVGMPPRPYRETVEARSYSIWPGQGHLPQNFRGCPQAIAPM